MFKKRDILRAICLLMQTRIKDLYHIAYKRSAVYIATAFVQLYRASVTSISQKVK